ncbi:MAG: tetratricopeptide repeat protein [bacterium]
MTQDEALAILPEGDPVRRRQAALVLAAIGDDRAVPALVHALADDDPALVHLVERALWEIWCRSGDPETDRLLQEGIETLGQQALDRAVDLFSQVIARAPQFAEGYNKRATALYLQGEYERSIADCESTLELNPHHFACLCGQGLCHLALRQFRQAEACFRKTLGLHPRMEAARHNLALAVQGRIAEGNGGPRGNGAPPHPFLLP